MNGISEADRRLFGLMEIAEGNQAAIQTALAGLVAEREALALERSAFAREVAALGEVTKGAVQTAVAASFAGAAIEGVKAVGVATKPLLKDLAAVTTATTAAEAALRRVVKWASWRLLGWVMGLIIALLAVGWACSTAVLWWDDGAISQAQQKKTQLQQEITGLRANYDGWVQLGMLDKITRCNPGNRPCVEVDENAGTFGSVSNPDFRVIKGY